MGNQIIIEVPGTPISELEQTSSVKPNDVLPIVQDEETKKAPLEQVSDMVKAGLGSAALKDEGDFATPSALLVVEQTIQQNIDATNERVDEVEFKTTLAQSGVEASFNSYAEMLAFTPSKPNVSVRVNNDTDASKVGTYTWTGTEYKKGTDLLVLASENATEKANVAEQNAIEYTDEKTQNIKVIQNENVVFGLADLLNQVFLYVSKNSDFYIPKLDGSIQQNFSKLAELINGVNSKVSIVDSPIAMDFRDSSQNLLAYFRKNSELVLAGLDNSVQENLNYLLKRQQDIMLSLSQHSVLLSKNLLTQNFSIDQTQALASTIQYDATTAQHLVIDTPYRKNDSLVHPNVIELDEPIRGFKYWMCLTPYSSNNILEENPCVYGSNDKLNWELIDGIPQPLDNPPDFDETASGKKGYLSDCWWVYDHINKELICCWRKAYTVGPNQYNDTDIMQLLGRSTKNGLIWSEPFQFYPDTLYGADTLISPSIVFDQNTNKWCMIYMRGANIIVMRTNDDFRNPNGWSDRIDLGFGAFKAQNPSIVAWHLETKFIGDRLYGLITDTANFAYYLCCASKTDLTQWTYSAHNILPIKPIGKPSTYKASLMTDDVTSTNAKIRMFWTSANTNESRLYTAMTNPISKN